MLQKLIVFVAAALLSLSVIAGEKGKGQEEGAGVSAEHQNEKGAEKGKAYAGTKENDADEETAEEGDGEDSADAEDSEEDEEAADDGKGKKEKKAKKDKGDKGSKQKGKKK